jgi:hypothetical protein
VYAYTSSLELRNDPDDPSSDKTIYVISAAEQTPTRVLAHPHVALPNFPDPDATPEQEQAYENLGLHKWYIVTRGWRVGVYQDWHDCHGAVTGASSASQTGKPRRTYFEAKRVFCEAVVQGKVATVPYILE